MKYLCFILMCHFSLMSQSKKVKIKLVQYIPYCGGAKPSAEMTKASETAIAYSHKKLILVSNKEKIDTVVTDKNGNFIKTLSYGVYKAYEPWKFYKKIPSGTQESNLNMDCLKEEWIKEDVKIIVSEKMTLTENNLKHPKCPYLFPCLINKHMPR